MYRTDPRRWRQLTVVLATALFLVVGVNSATADPVVAVAGDCITTPDGGAKACFHSSEGDGYAYLEVCDNKPDGHHPGAFYTIQSSPNTQRLIEHFLGHPACEGRLLNLPEDSWIDFRAMNMEGDDILSASPWIRSYD